MLFLHGFSCFFDGFSMVFLCFRMVFDGFPFVFHAFRRRPRRRAENKFDDAQATDAHDALLNCESVRLMSASGRVLRRFDRLWWRLQENQRPGKRNASKSDGNPWKSMEK